MTVQTSYSIDHGEAYAGMVADQQLRNQVSRLNNTGAIIAYGKGVITGSVEGAMAVATAAFTAAKFIGILQYELNQAQADGAIAGVPDKRDGTVVSDGVVWAENLVAVVQDDPVFLRIGTTDTGSWSNVVGAGVTLGQLIPNAKWVSTQSTVKGLARIKFNVGG